MTRRPAWRACETTGGWAMAKFDPQTLSELRDVQEVVIRTEKHPKSAVVIWAVVADDEVFVRSWLRGQGGWYRGPPAGGRPTPIAVAALVLRLIQMIHYGAPPCLPGEGRDPV